MAQQEKVLQLLAHVNGAGAFDPTLLNALSANQPSYPDIIPIRGDRDTVRLQVGTIDWIYAAGDYMCIKTGDNTLILRQTMKDLEKRLDPRRFQRVHRSTIANKRRIVEIQPWFQGDYVVILRDGTRLTTGKRYREAVRSLLD